MSHAIQTNYKEVTQLLKLVLTFPGIKASPEKSRSTLKRVKSNLHNSMKNERSSTIAIEKKLDKQLAVDQSFKKRVIDTFATKKNRLLDLLYKKIYSKQFSLAYPVFTP